MPSLKYTFLDFAEVVLKAVLKPMTRLIGTLVMSLALLLPMLPSAQAETTFDLPGAQSAYADIDDIRMYYEIYGKGEPLLLISPAYIPYLIYQLPELSNHFQVITPELRGHWRTTDSPKPLSYRLMAEDVVRLLDHLKIQSAYVVGWSDGGDVGLFMARDHPDRVRKLVTIGSNYHTNGLTDDFVGWCKQLTPETFPSRDTYMRLAPDPAHWPVFVKKITEMWLSEPVLTTDDLKQIQCPTLVMVGDRDAIKMDHTVDLFEALPRGQLMVVPGASHMVPREKPVIVNAAILSFLSEETARGKDSPSRKNK